MKRLLKEKKAITLIALVITIVVLVILAVVTISLTVGNDGLIARAIKAAKGYKDAQERDKQGINDLYGQLVVAADGNISNLTLQQLNDVIDTEVNLRMQAKENEIKTQKIMSGSEHFTGEYYINGKPIYEKTVYIASFPTTISSTYNHGISNVDVIWYKIDKCLICTNTNMFNPATFVSTISADFDGKTVTNNCISLQGVGKDTFKIATFSANRSTWSAYITLNYTKTTDSATITPNIPTVTPN